MVATAFVVVLPAVLVSAVVPSHSLISSMVSVFLAVGVSVGAGRVAAAYWMRRPGSKDLVFADLMLWGWLRRLWAERRLAQAQRRLATTEASGAPQRVEGLERLGRMLEARDAYTHGHSQRVARHAARIARRMHLPQAEIAKVRTAATVHDVGKIHTPRAILNKPGRLTDEEFAVVKRHPVDGAEMLANIGDPELVAMVRHHHERLDGRGYPDGLMGEAIPLGARIIAVADTFDAITSSRAYRSSRTHKKALDILAMEAGTQLDETAVAAFLGYYSGRRSVMSTALLAAVPQRVSALLGQVSPTLGGAAAIGQALSVAGVAALVGVSPAPATDSSALHVTPTPVTVTHASEPTPAPAVRTPRRGRSPGGDTAKNVDGPAPTRPTPSPSAKPTVLVEPTNPSGVHLGDEIRVPPRVTTPSVTVPSASLPATPAVTVAGVTVPSAQLPATPSVTTPSVTLPPVTTPPVTIPVTVE